MAANRPKSIRPAPKPPSIHERTMGYLLDANVYETSVERRHVAKLLIENEPDAPATREYHHRLHLHRTVLIQLTAAVIAKHGPDYVLSGAHRASLNVEAEGLLDGSERFMLDRLALKHVSEEEAIAAIEAIKEAEAEVADNQPSLTADEQLRAAEDAAGLEPMRRPAFDAMGNAVKPDATDDAILASLGEGATLRIIDGDTADLDEWPDGRGGRNEFTREEVADITGKQPTTDPRNYQPGAIDG